jgi:hypothetical protein
MKRNRTIVAVTLLIVLFAGAWAFGLFGGADPAVAELQQMADQAFAQNLSVVQEAQLRDQFRERMEALTPDQRRAFFEANRDRWLQRTEQRMDEFFAMTAAQQRQRLDEIIDRMSQPREQRSDRAGRGDRGRGDWRNMTEAQRDERSKRRLDSTSPKARAQFAEFRKKLDERAKERGISQLPGWGFGGRRG